MEHQKDALFDPSRFKILVWHRRARKTTTAITEIVRQSQLRVGVYWHIFPTYTEGKDAIWRDPTMLFNIVPEELVRKKNDQELIIYFKNGSIYQLKGADKPDSLRGAGPVGIVLDEYATMKPSAWEVVEPVLRQNGGWCWFVGTPKGRNHLFEMYQRGIGTNKEWKAWLLKASTSGIISPSELEESRKTSHSQAFYNQEWECEFLEGEGSVFRNVYQIATAYPTPPIKNHYYVMGVDIAKVEDYTVISVFDRATNSQVYQDRFNKLEWPYQKAKIKEIAKHYNNALVILDATGIGDPIADDLLRDGVSVEPFKISQQSKKDLIEKLSIWIEQKKCRIINIQESLYEYDNFAYEIGTFGGIRYGAREGFHDDIVISHSLSVYGLQPLLKVEKPVEKSPLQVHYEAVTKPFNYADVDEI